jgi:hypothetical protein
MKSTSRFSGLVRLVAVGALALGAVGLAGAPASAATSSDGFLSTNGNSFAAGAPITATYAVPPGQGTASSVTLTVVFQNGNTQLVGTQWLNYNPSTGYSTATFNFPVFTTGADTLQAVSNTGVTSTVPLQIVNVQTFTNMTASNTAQVNVPNNVTATVTSASPSTMRPAGTVTFLDVNNNPVTTVNLTAGTATGQSVATWVWTPRTLGTFIFSARFNPANGNPSITSGSTPQSILVTPSGSPISLSVPPLNVGVPATLVAQLSPPTLQGSVGFTYNGKPISPSVPIVNGQASFVWTPAVQGQAILGANFTTNSGQTGATSTPVTIGGTTQPDVITLAQPGFGTWAPNATYRLGNGTTFTFQATAASGAPVTLKNTGPCNNSGLTLTIDTGTGQCNLVASSPGGNGYAPNSQGYTVQMVPGTQTLAVQPPLSGRVNKGRTIRLEGPGQSDTNAGQNVNWTIRSGKNVCQLRFPANGAVNLRTVRTGTCTIRGTAPAVPNAWNRLVVDRTYNVR